MERNDDFGSTGGLGDNAGTSGSSFGSGGLGNTGGTSGSAGYGSGSGAAGTPTSGYGSEAGLGGSYGAGGANYSSTGTPGSTGTQGAGLREQAGEKLGQAREAASNKLGQVKEKASNLTATLADKLEAGAERLRNRQPGDASMAYAGGAGTATAGAQDERVRAMGNQLAGGMQGAADWLREGDLRQTVEQQVRTNPGRTLLIAVGVGYLLGKALRK